MKKKLISVFAIFILCLSLFLTGALAADETTVTITNKDGESITLTAGKFYIVNDDVGGGVTVMDTIDNLTGYYFYLTYDGNGTLTLCSNGGNTCTIRNVSMNVEGGNLTIKSEISNLGRFNFHMSDTFQLNGATLTLDVPSFSLGKATNDTKPLIDNGTIVFADKQSQGELTLENGNGVIADDLTIQNANTVNLSGFTATGGVFSNNLTVQNCGSVTITQMNPANTVVIDDDKITNDGHDNIVHNVTELDISQFDFTKTQEILDKLEQDTPIQYKAGDGSIDFQQTTGGSLKMTLDNAVAEDGRLLIGTVEFEPPDTVNRNLKDVIIEVKGDNKIATLDAKSIELTGGGSLTGELCTEGGTFTKDSFQGNLNALAISFSDSDSDSDAQGIVTVYGKADWSLASFGFSVRQLIVSEGATLTIPSGYTVEIPLNVNADGAPIPVTIEGEIVNNGTVTLTGATTLDTPIDDKIKEIITQTLKLSGAGKVEVPVGSADGSAQTTYYSNSGVKQLETAGELDLSSVTETKESTDQGYKWVPILDNDTDKNITGGMLTLKEGFNATKVTLPDATVTIVTEGDSTIGTLDISSTEQYWSGPQKTQLTFSVPIEDGTPKGGTLTVTEQISICGGDNNSLTVNTGATVIANGGIVIGASGSVNSTVTVNGSLQISSEYTALSAGSVVVGNTGNLKISGNTGVQLNGMPNDKGNYGDSGYKNVFTVMDGGKFNANCSDYNITVQDSSNIDLTNIINSNEFDFPTGYEMGKTNDNVITIINSKTNQPYKGKLVIHSSNDHDFAHNSYEFDETKHWKVCGVEGCSKKQNSSEGNHQSTGNNAANCQKKATCDTCGEEYGELGAHDFSGAWDSDGAEHWHACQTEGCTAKKDETAHTESTTYESIDNEKHLKKTICSVCNKEISSANENHTFDNNNDATCNDCGYTRHVHNWNTEWSHDAFFHWYDCTANGCTVTDNSEKNGYGAHDWVYDIEKNTKTHYCKICTMPQSHSDDDGDGICDNCGYQPDPSEHLHSWSNKWSVSNTHHWHECAATPCPDPIANDSQKGDYGTHDYDDDSDTTCNVCGYEREIDTPENPDSTYNITVDTTLGYGKIEISPNSAKAGETVTLTPKPAEGYHLVSLTVTDSEDTPIETTSHDDGTYTFTMPERNVTVTTVFEKNSYNVTVDDSEQNNGTVDIDPNPATVGEKVTLTATPNSGYHFKEWNVKSGNVTLSNEQKITNPLTFIMPAGDVKIEAVFEKDSVPSRPSGGGGGGGSSSSSSSITIEQPEHGKITSNRPSASRGTSVTLTVTPDDGYQMKSLTVTDSQNNAIKLTDQGDGKYTFTMPGAAIKVKAVFEPLPEPSKSDENNGDAAPALSYSDYTDLDSNAWYSGAVDYVLKAGLMQGYGDKTFAPNDTLSRAMLAQILYNREGKPATTGNSGFTDVTDGQWYAPAVAWAASKGIISGYNDGRFGSNDNITREQVTVMLWRYAGSPAAKNQELSFSDTDETSEWAADALRWAVENDILHGYNDGRLDPKGFITRAETAQILQNYLK